MIACFRLALAALVLLAAAPSAQTVDALLVPDSINKRILRLDPATGDVIDAAWAADTRFGTIIQAIGGFDGEGALVSDQIADVVWRVSGTGEVLGVFAPAGGVNTAVLDNIRGIALSADGNRLLVTVASGGNQNSVVAFDRNGALVGTAVAAGAGALDSPWSLLERSGDLLVSASGSRAVLRYSPSGEPLGVFADVQTFPQQITSTAAGGVLVANFSPVATRGVYEYDAGGALLRTIQLGPLEGAPRGVAELPGGTLLVATSAGVYEVDRTGAILSTKVSGGQYRFFGRARLLPPVASEAGAPASGLSIERVAPNPTAGAARVSIRVAEPQALRVVLVDALGREVAVLHDGAAPAGVLALSTAGRPLAPGVYVVRATGEAAAAVGRLVVAR